jgi:hypothetical protein
LPSPLIAIKGSPSVLADGLWRSLSLLYDVQFVGHDDARSAQANAIVMIGVSLAEARRMAGEGLACLAFVDPPDGPPRQAALPVQFSETRCPIPSFRDAALVDDSMSAASGMMPAEGDLVIASVAARPVWLRSNLAAGGVLDLVCASPPLLGAEGALYSQFNPRKWFALLPLLHLVKQVSGWDFGRPRACVMLDDPNLHWPSYGYVRYQQIADDAEERNYHCSFATVPMDGWYVNGTAASVFARNQKRLSLLVHGNEHTSHELCRKVSDDETLAVAAHALRRTHRIERRSGLEIDRVMAPPHEACNEQMATALARVGFMAACVSRGSLMSRNPHVQFPSHFGFAPADFLGEGVLPMLPRFHLKEDANAKARLAFTLGQPAIAVGHHEDLWDGLAPFHRMADVCNSIGNVHWANAGKLSETNYWTRREGNSLIVRMFSRSLTLQVPSGVTRLVFERPWPHRGGSERVAVKQGSTSTVQPFNGLRSEPASITSSGATHVTVLLPAQTSPPAARRRQARLWPLTRRFLCEARDRVRPAIDRLDHARRGERGLTAQNTQ